MIKTNVETSEAPTPEMESTPPIKFGDIGVVKGHNFEHVSLLLPPIGADTAAGAIAIVDEVDAGGNKRTRYGRMGTIDEKTVLGSVGHVEYEDAIRIIAHSLDSLYDDEEPKAWALDWARQEYPDPQADK